MPDRAKPPASNSVLQWLFQRLSGLVLSWLVLAHLWTTAFAPEHPLTLEAVKARLAGCPCWGVFYGLFIPLVLYHALSGLYGILLDFNLPDELNSAARKILLILGLALGAFGFYILTGFYV